MIKLQVIGHLGKDAVVRDVNGNNVINFNVAHTSKYRNKEGVNVEKTTWVSCSYWIQSTGIAPYLKKGQQVFVEGEPETEVYNRGDNFEGITALQKCRVSKVELLGSKSGNSGQQNSQPSANTGNNSSNYKNADEVTEPIDDLPF